MTDDNRNDRGYVIYTSRWSNKELAAREDLVKVCTSIGKPKFDPGFTWEEIKDLAPYGLFHLNGPEFDRKYVARLEKVGVRSLMGQMNTISAKHGGKDLVLLCYEFVPPGMGGEHACHRRVFAKWWFEQTGEVVEELAATLRHPVPLTPEQEQAQLAFLPPEPGEEP